MSCDQFRKSLSGLLDNCLTELERAQTTRHLSWCGECKSRWDDLRSARKSLRRLPCLRAPESLKMQLRVAASRDRSQRISGSTRWTRLRFRLETLMKPLAVPAVGGLLASVLLFTSLASTLEFREDLRNDIPLGLFTQVSIERISPFAVNDDHKGGMGQDVTVVVTIDENGHPCDYSVPGGAAAGQQELREIGNTLLFTTFSPAKAYGQPISGKVLLSLQHINVQG